MTGRERATSVGGDELDAQRIDWLRIEDGVGEDDLDLLVEDYYHADLSVDEIAPTGFVPAAGRLSTCSCPPAPAPRRLTPLGRAARSIRCPAPCKHTADQNRPKGRVIGLLARELDDRDPTNDIQRGLRDLALVQSGEAVQFPPSCSAAGTRTHSKWERHRRRGLGGPRSDYTGTALTNGGQPISRGACSTSPSAADRVRRRRQASARYPRGGGLVAPVRARSSCVVGAEPRRRPVDRGMVCRRSHDGGRFGVPRGVGGGAVVIEREARPRLRPGQDGPRTKWRSHGHIQPNVCILRTTRRPDGEALAPVRTQPALSGRTGCCFSALVDLSSAAVTCERGAYRE